MVGGRGYRGLKVAEGLNEKPRNREAERKLSMGEISMGEPPILPLIPHGFPTRRNDVPAMGEI